MPPASKPLVPVLGIAGHLIAHPSALSPWGRPCRAPSTPEDERSPSRHSSRQIRTVTWERSTEILSTPSVLVPAKPLSASLSVDPGGKSNVEGRGLFSYQLMGEVSPSIYTEAGARQPSIPRSACLLPLLRLLGWHGQQPPVGFRINHDFASLPSPASPALNGGIFREAMGSLGS